jgi:cytochrome c-type biogenesis protein CcmH
MRAALVAALCAMLVLPAGALAAGCPKTTMPDVEDEVMCLQCGVPLNLAEDAPSAQRERAFIQGLIDQCRSKAQIKDALVAQFGDRVLAEPKSSSAWLVPAIGFGAGALLVGVAAWQWRRRRRTPVAGAAAPAAADSARLDADLERYEL